MSDGDNGRLAEWRDLRDLHTRHGSTTAIAYWTIRDAIRKGVIRAGDRLVELELAEALEMSRTPVREALRRLEAERLVEIAPRRGYVVPTITLDELVDIFEIREVLEGLAARRAAQRMGPAELEALRETVERRERAYDANDLPALRESTVQFHRLLRAGAKNGRLPELVALLFDAHRSLGLHEMAPERVEAAIAEHRAICDAIAARDADLAEQLTRQHARNALRAQILAHHLAD